MLEARILRGFFHLEGFLKCRGTTTCVHPENICDGVLNCPLLGDDEQFCDRSPICPVECVCQHFIVTCTNLLLVGNVLRYDSRILVLKTATVSQGGSAFLGFHNLHVLNMTNSYLSKVHLLSNMFNQLVILKILDLRYTNIFYFPSHAFKGLYSLRIIIFIGCTIHNIEEYILPNSNNLMHLNIDSVSLSAISERSFYELNEIRSLNLSHNQLSTLTLDTFYSLNNLETLDISHNLLIAIIRSDRVSNFQIDTVLSDASGVCCYFTTSKNCTPNAKVVHTEGYCRSTLSNSSFIFYSYISIGIVIIITNACSIVCKHTMRTLKKDIVFTNNLSLADSLLGLYYILVAVSEGYYKDNVLQIKDPLVLRWICRLLGILPPLSIVMSTTIVSLISLQRLMVTKYHFAKKLINIHSVQNQNILMMLIWIFCASVVYTYVMHCSLTSLLCFMPYSAHNDNVLIIVITVMLFIVYSCICVIISIVAYINIVCYVAKVEQIRQKTLTVKTSRSAVSKTAILIILVSLCNCIGIAIIVIVGSVTDSNEVNTAILSFALVLCLPWNSIANPFLFTFLQMFKAKLS